MCHVFAGDGPLLRHGMADVASMKGVRCDEWDVKQDPDAHDLSKPEPADRLYSDCETAGYDLLHAGIPCRTFTPILTMRGRQLRARHQPWGRDGLDADQQRRVEYDDGLIEMTCKAAYIVYDQGGEVTFENVADRGDPDGPAYWPEKAEMCPLVLHPRVVAAMAYMGMVTIHLPLCALNPGGPQKWITIFATPGAARVLAPLGRLRCYHRSDEHGPSIGRDAQGVSHAAATASYPVQLNWWLTEVPLRIGGAAAGREIRWGSDLHPVVRRAVEEARRSPLAFASFRRVAAAPREDRWRMRVPTPHDVAAECEQGAPDAGGAVSEEGSDDEAAAVSAGLPRPPRPNTVPIPGAPPRPIAYHQIWRRIPELGDRRVGYDKLVEWREKARIASVAISKGEPYEDPGTLVLSEDLKEPWARRKQLDCRDHLDVLMVRRSSRRTVFPGRKQVNRAALRGMAEATGWYEVDPDLMAQVGEGGIESRSFAGKFSVFQFHHRGVALHFEEANAVNAKELGNGWLLGPFEWPPFEPMRSLPHNVIIQSKLKVAADGTQTTKLKPRVLTNGSAYEADSINRGVRRGDRTVALPSAQSHAGGVGVTDSIVRRGSVYVSVQYASDLGSAYRFLLMARICWPEQCSYMCIIVVLPGGRTVSLTGWFVDPRLYFGGAFAPNRFERFARIKRAYTRMRQHAFDAREQPLPDGVRAVIEERRALQEAGVLPTGEDQLRPDHLQVFIDDETGSASGDPVAMPRDVNTRDPSAPRFIDVAAIVRNTADEGGRPAAETSRGMAHLCISIDTSLRLDLEVADKSQCGDGIVVLGLRCDAAEDRLDVPPPKARVMETELLDLRQAVLDERPVDRSAVERNVGRLCNASQVDPATLFHIHFGYALIHAATRATARSPRRRHRWLHLKPSGDTARGFVTMVDSAVATLREQRGVPLVPEVEFPHHSEVGTALVQTDASGEDGGGGFAFVGGRPNEVWVVSDRWPDDVRAALARSATSRQVRAATPAEALMSMPAGELFIPWAVVEAVCARVPGIMRTIAVMDCRPATLALTSGKSKAPLMRAILRRARTTMEQWLGAHVRRDRNTDADLLSHPESVQRVVTAAEAAGMVVHVISCFPQTCWDHLREDISRCPTG